MIRYADRAWIPQLRQLWKTCFADEDAYINDFFEAMYEKEHVLYEEENGVLMGASFFLPAEIWQEPSASGGFWQPVRYVYALAVWPQYRGRGIAARLLGRAREIYDAPLLAEPADRELVEGFYTPLGFAPDFYLKRATASVPHDNLRAAETDRWEQTAATAAEYRRIRDAHFKRNGYVRWPQRHIAFAIQQHIQNGGGACILRTDGREELVLYNLQQQDVFVTETTLPEEEAIQVLPRRICGTCSRIIVTTAAGSGDIRTMEAAGSGDIRAAEVVAEGTQTVTGAAAGSGCFLTGMSYGLARGYGYLNLSLD